ncbi:phage tail protein [Cupriavidus necator N-1]|uniref:Phage tail protein n=1 Tax=Cupriavidus necator (strain ATCC 43291 / DSM 13513 / CCUG 52238 / LMG 8453 / N-1) TaxID=1042878 RepID=G0ER43_CUPNN|nr:hypothetical protein [Cupriavidus necator]AEI76561.1 phage tail protein [Cupriavidus necator N-1]MDX6011316.1 phage tail protein [Cupriavidus necator]
MRRISTSTKVTDKFGAGKHGFTNGNAVGGIPATDLEDVWFDHAQEEICSPIEAAGLALDSNDRTQLLQAMQILSAPIVGLMRKARMSVTAASASATFLADQIVVATALGGKHYRLSGFSKTVNLATTGAGGMDTGSAPTSGYVALYAIYNQTSGASALLATNATSAVASHVYSGANMPAGYTASALVSVWPTNGSGQFTVGQQQDRDIYRNSTSVLSTTTSATSVPFTSLSISSAVPPNAVRVKGTRTITFTSATGCAPSFAFAPDSGGSGGNLMYVSGSTSSGPNWGMDFESLVVTQQTLYYAIGNSAAVSVTYAASIVGYSI